MNDKLMEEVIRIENVRTAYKAVKANGGAPGVDRMSVEEFGASFARRWEAIESKLLEGTYRPGAVLGVEIPKPNGGKRMLGIPNVQDRVIQQAVHQILSPIFEEKFSAHSYGFRPQRSAHDAVKAAQGYIESGKCWVVDIDLKAFFDQVDHDILMREVGREIRDKSLLKLIGGYLRAPMELGGRRQKRLKGTPQGGPLSPLLANIYLTPLDKELEKRGLSFVRYADDIAIYVSSERSAERVLARVVEWLSRELKLEVNLEKSRAGGSGGSTLLGFKIVREKGITVSKKAMERMKAKVRELWNAQQSKTSGELRAQWRQYIDGWWNYYRLGRVNSPLRQAAGWIRRHIRKCFWIRWHNATGRKAALRKLGVKGPLLKLAHCSAGAWPMAAHAVMNTALSKAHLRRYGLDVPWTVAVR